MSYPTGFFRFRQGLPFVILALSACAARGVGDRSESDDPRGKVISAAEIQQTGASTAWEALKFTAPAVLDAFKRI